MAYDNTNRWTLNKNDRKAQDNHPDYKGSINVDGVDFWLDGWIKDGANGKFISGSLKRKDSQSGGQGGYGQQTQPAPIDLEDDIPFVTCDPSLESRVR